MGLAEQQSGEATPRPTRFQGRLGSDPKTRRGCSARHLAKHIVVGLRDLGRRRALCRTAVPLPLRVAPLVVPVVELCERDSFLTQVTATGGVFLVEASARLVWVVNAHLDWGGLSEDWRVCARQRVSVLGVVAATKHGRFEACR
jgi:hypothetical protein